MIVSPWVARLKESGTPFRQVGGAAELDAALTGGLKAAPAAFLLPLAETASENQRVNAVLHQVGAAVGVVIVVRNLADARGDQAVGDLETARAWARTKLLGWQPSGAHDPVEYAGGRVLALANGYLWWQDDWETAYVITSP
ncbi:MAG: hypothetical protein IPP91_11300 [Betaproteobacteria bacterium]|nr:hypothetical protein [Betaproteobacteria bacterium]